MVNFVILIQTRVIWDEGTPIKHFLPSDYTVEMSLEVLSWLLIDLEHPSSLWTIPLLDSYMILACMREQVEKATRSKPIFLPGSVKFLKFYVVATASPSSTSHILSSIPPSIPPMHLSSVFTQKGTHLPWASANHGLLTCHKTKCLSLFLMYMCF